MSNKNKNKSDSSSKTIFIVITILLVGIIATIFIVGSKTDNLASNSVQNLEVRDGIQYITINAGGGYSPKISSAKGGIPTKLIVKTNGTYDCSSSLVINSINYRKILPPTGEEVIDIGTKEIGSTLQGVCGMGMYSFKINFL